MLSQELKLDPEHYKQRLSQRLNSVLDSAFIFSDPDHACSINIRSFVENIHRLLQTALSLQEADPLRCLLRGSIARSLLLDRDAHPADLADIDLFIDLSEYPLNLLITNRDVAQALQQLLEQALYLAADKNKPELDFYADVSLEDDYPSRVFARVTGKLESTDQITSLEIFLRLKETPICVFPLDDLGIVLPVSELAQGEHPQIAYCSTSFYNLEHACRDALNRQITVCDDSWMPSADALVRAFRHVSQGYDISMAHRRAIIQACIHDSDERITCALRRLVRHRFTPIEKALFRLQTSIISPVLLPDDFLPDSRIIYFHTFAESADPSLLLYLISAELSACAPHDDNRALNIARISNWIAPWIAELPLSPDGAGRLLYWPRFSIEQMEGTIKFDLLNVSPELGMAIFALRTAYDCSTPIPELMEHTQLIEDHFIKGNKCSAGMAWLYLAQLPLHWSTVKLWDMALAMLESDESCNSSDSAYIIAMAPAVREWCGEGTPATLANVRDRIWPQPLTEVFDIHTLRSLSEEQLNTLHYYLTSDNISLLQEHCSSLTTELASQIYLRYRRNISCTVQQLDATSGWLLLASRLPTSWAMQELLCCLEVVMAPPSSASERYAQQQLFRELQSKSERLEMPWLSRCLSSQMIPALLPYLSLPYGLGIDPQALEHDRVDHTIINILTTLTELMQQKAVAEEWLLPIIWMIHHAYASDKTYISWDSTYQESFVNFWQQQADPAKAALDVLIKLEPALVSLLGQLLLTQQPSERISENIARHLNQFLFALGAELEPKAPLRSVLIAQVLLIVNYHRDGLLSSMAQEHLDAPEILWAISVLVNHAPQLFMEQMQHRFLPWLRQSSELVDLKYHGKARLENLWRHLVQALPIDAAMIERYLELCSSWPLLHRCHLTKTMRKQWLRLAEDSADDLTARIAALPLGLSDDSEVDIVLKICAQLEAVPQCLTDTLNEYIQRRPSFWHSSLDQAIRQLDRPFLLHLVLSNAPAILMSSKRSAAIDSKLLEIVDAMGSRGTLNDPLLAPACLILMQKKNAIGKQLYEALAHAVCQLSDAELSCLSKEPLKSSLSTLLLHLATLKYHSNHPTICKLLEMASWAFQDAEDEAISLWKALNNKGIRSSALLRHDKVRIKIMNELFEHNKLSAEVAIDLVQSEPAGAVTVLSGLLELAIQRIQTFAIRVEICSEMSGMKIASSPQSELGSSLQLCRMIVALMSWIGNAPNWSYPSEEADAPDQQMLLTLMSRLIHGLIDSQYVGHWAYAWEILRLWRAGNGVSESSYDMWRAKFTHEAISPLPIYDQESLMLLCRVCVEGTEAELPQWADINGIATQVVHPPIPNQDTSIQQLFWSFLREHEHLLERMYSQFTIDLLIAICHDPLTGGVRNSTVFKDPQTSTILSQIAPKAITALKEPPLHNINNDVYQAAIKQSLYHITWLLEKFPDCHLSREDIIEYTEIIATTGSARAVFSKFPAVFTSLYDDLALESPAPLSTEVLLTVASFYLYQGTQELQYRAFTGISGQACLDDISKVHDLAKAFTLTSNARQCCSHAAEQWNQQLRLMGGLCGTDPKTLNSYLVQTPPIMDDAAFLARLDARLMHLLTQVASDVEHESATYLNFETLWIVDIFALLIPAKHWSVAAEIRQTHHELLCMLAAQVCSRCHPPLLEDNPALSLLNLWVYCGARLFLQRMGAASATPAWLFRTTIDTTDITTESAEALACVLASLYIMILESTNNNCAPHLFEQIRDWMPFHNNISSLMIGIRTTVHLLTWLDEDLPPDAYMVIGKLLNDILQAALQLSDESVCHRDIAHCKTSGLPHTAMPLFPSLLQLLQQLYQRCKLSDDSSVMPLFTKHVLAPMTGVYSLACAPSKAIAELAHIALISWDRFDALDQCNLLQYIMRAAKGGHSILTPSFQALSKIIRNFTAAVELDTLCHMFNTMAPQDKALAFDWMCLKLTVGGEWSRLDDSRQAQIMDMFTALIDVCDQMEMGTVKGSAISSILAVMVGPWCDQRELAFTVSGGIPDARVLELVHSALPAKQMACIKDKTAISSSYVTSNVSAGGYNDIFSLIHMWRDHLPQQSAELCELLSSFMHLAGQRLAAAANAGSQTATWCIETLNDPASAKPPPKIVVRTKRGKKR